MQFTEPGWNWRELPPARGVSETSSPGGPGLPDPAGPCPGIPVSLYPLKSGKLPDDIGLGQYSHRLLALHNHQPPDLPLFEPADNFKEMDG